MPADVNNAFDVVFFFDDLAIAENVYLQPQKIQRLLFLSQAYYAVAFRGRKLMPAVFVADEMGPVEPNIYMAFSRGKPDVDVEIFLSQEVISFLEGIWKRFHDYPVERLTNICMDTSGYQAAKKRGERAEITLKEMQESFTQNRDAPAIEQVIKPKIMRTQDGRPVVVKSWNPGGG